MIDKKIQKATVLFSKKIDAVILQLTSRLRKASLEVALKALPQVAAYLEIQCAEHVRNFSHLRQETMAYVLRAMVFGGKRSDILAYVANKTSELEVLSKNIDKIKPPKVTTSKPKSAKRKG